VESAVNLALEEIDESEYAGSSVSQKETIEFYEGIIEGCQLRIHTIRQDMGEDDAEKDEDEDGDEEDDDEDGDDEEE
jgi:hypothetical protein